MMENNWRKAVQKQVYDILSHRYGLLVILIGSILIISSAFYFGEAVVEWSTEKYAAVFNSFSDNVAGRSFRERLCLPVPIDVVYTWVNGTDPDLVFQLQRVKLDMEEELNISREEVCVFSHCLKTNIIILDPELPGNMTLNELIQPYPIFGSALRMFRVTSPLDKKNYTAIVFAEESEAVAVVNQTRFMIHGKNTTVGRCHITSDWTVQNSVMLKDQIIMSGFPHTYTADDLKEKFPDKHRKGIEKIDIYPDKGLAVLYVPKKEDFEKLVDLSNFTIEGKEPTLNAANLVWDLRDFSRDEDISASRFEDNEELRYSLRSIERFAPWVRHIYIVTNGQIPYWLNLENPRVTLVTHEELFPNRSHLPTFSSPAIESHLHRIEGLSDKFIYMNDDVMFGKDVWPDDFFTHSTGQKVYLTWPVPSCQEGCPSNWIKDGYCDKACNNSDCEWDGGDCHGQSQSGVGQWHGGLGGWEMDTKVYCNSGCANNWIADRYCDVACNVFECGFDAGDCGTADYHKMYGIQLMDKSANYTLPKGKYLAYFNLTTLLTSKGSVISADYMRDKVIRTVAVALKFQVMTVVLYPGHNATKLQFSVKGHKGNISDIVEVNFTLSVNTMEDKTVENITIVKAGDSKNMSVAMNKTAKSNETKVETVVFEEVPPELQGPRIHVDREKKTTIVHQPSVSVPSNMSAVQLPGPWRLEWDSIVKDFKDGDLTEKGFQIKKEAFWLKYVEFQKHALQAGPNDSPIVQGSKVKDGIANYSADVNVKAANRHLLYIEEDFNIDFQGIPNMEQMQVENGRYGPGLLPWERSGSFSDIQKEKERVQKEKSYQVHYHSNRRLLDTFGDSLRHVNKLYNKAFGYQARKVPGHMPHMVDKHVMKEMQDMFPEHWDVTSGNKIRSSKDMQYAFSYFYYIMGKKENITAAQIFDEMDTDKSKVLSDREIRTLATRLYELPLDLQTLTSLEQTFINCSKTLHVDKTYQPEQREIEVYYEKEMVTRNLVINCNATVKLLLKNFKPKYKYPHTIVDEGEVAFKMIKTNISSVVGQLDDVRKHPKKFICLNDNIDHTQEQAKTVKAILQDFYESLFPLQSQFELPRDYRNRFMHISELREWRRYRDWLKFWTHIALAILVLFTVASFFADKIEAAQRRLGRRLNRNNGDSVENDGEGESTPSTSRHKASTVETV